MERLPNPNQIHIHHYSYFDAGGYALGGDEPDAACSWCGALLYDLSGPVVSRSPDAPMHRRLSIYLEQTGDRLYLCEACLDNDVQVAAAMQDEAIGRLATLRPTGSAVERARELMLLSRALLGDIAARVEETRQERRERIIRETRDVARWRAAWRDKTGRQAPPAVPVKPRPTNVYLMRSKTTGFIKIGQSVKPKQRRTQLQSELDDKLEILRVIPDEVGGLESKLHHRFRHLRTVHPNSPRGREWFAPDDELLGFAADA